ncbi:MAG: nuclear transport factor 2 family protein [Pseudomonadota bacterium]
MASWRTSPEAPFDLDAVSHLYAQDETFSSFDFGRPPDGFQSWAPADAYYRKFFAVPKVWRLEPNDDLRVHIRGDFAWSIVSLTGGGEMPDGRPIAMPEARVTLILERRDGDWLIVHEHGPSALPIPDDETAKRFIGS